ncbi:hypothetical protein OH492_19120 [Vibrio chagasii]|nr:hypothetical protein [Vibrio chagasii]
MACEEEEALYGLKLNLMKGVSGALHDRGSNIKRKTSIGESLLIIKIGSGAGSKAETF